MKNSIRFEREANLLAKGEAREERAEPRRARRDRFFSKDQPRGTEHSGADGYWRLLDHSAVAAAVSAAQCGGLNDEIVQTIFKRMNRPGSGITGAVQENRPDFGASLSDRPKSDGRCGELEEFIVDAVSGLRRGLDPDWIYLFGSHARGDATADSDVDFLVVVPDSELPRHRRAQMARAMVPSTHYPKDIIVLTRSEWDRGAGVPVSLVNTVRREGQLLHARG